MARSILKFWHGSISLPRAHAERLKAIADERGSSLAEIVREAVRDFLRRLDQQQRRAS